MSKQHNFNRKDKRLVLLFNYMANSLNFITFVRSKNILWASTPLKI